MSGASTGAPDIGGSMRIQSFLSRSVLCLAVSLLAASAAFACDTPVGVCAVGNPASLALIQGGRPASVYVDPTADPAVRRAAEGLREDLGRVGGGEAAKLSDLSKANGSMVIVGVLGASPAVDALVKSGKLKVEGLAGQWEGFRQVVVDRPAANIPRALVIVGADRRGAVYGAYDLSERIGVSPWSWWADVPVAKKHDLFLTAGARADHPRVKYRGFFINDEDPAFSGWAKARFGSVNADAYAHVFELLLRLRGNYLWPAMWGKAFNDDDPRSKVLADEMGVIMGTSHHEPMTRAQSEWRRKADKGLPSKGERGGRWDYEANGDNLRTFWRGGIERMMSKGDGTPYESLVTVGMRGDGDEPMAEGAATQLLEKVVADQRKIIAEVTGKPPEKTPQVWALYKEVQDYYDHGMRVPDDVTLLFADDNWGQIRRLPVPGQDPLDRAGGYGVYYHFDYVGGPRNYKWINTIQVAKTWQQMDLAYERGARNLWIVNVGDIKPLEYPLDFFMRMAWNPEAMTAQALEAFPRRWASQTFGAALGPDIGEVMATYGTYASRRKPELIDQDSFPLGEGMGPVLDGGEFGQMIEDWRALVGKVEAIKVRLRADQQEAYFQLVEYPVLAFSNLYEMYYATAWNRRLASKGDARANDFATQVEVAFKRDADLTAQYHARNGGKWAGMMNQVHMSYVTWNDPPRQVMPNVTRVAAGASSNPTAGKVRFAPERQNAPGVIDIQAKAFARARGGKGLTWTVLADLGQSDAVVALPQGRGGTTIGDGVRLEYDVSLPRPGRVGVWLRLAPTLDTTGGKGMRIGVAIDDGPAQTLVAALVPAVGAPSAPEEIAWITAVTDNAHVVGARFEGVAAGRHVVKVWRLDDNVVLEKISIVQP
jgi:hypothetical protein